MNWDEPLTEEELDKAVARANKIWWTFWGIVIMVAGVIVLTNV